MKTKLLYFVFTFLFLFACSTLKKTSETSLKTSIDSKASLTKDIQLNTDSTKTDKSKTNNENTVDKSFDQVSSQSGNITGTLKMYDPTKPIDPLTGKPPLVSELDFTNKTQTDNTVTENVKTGSKSEIINDIKTAVKKGLDVKIDSAAESKVISDQKALTTKSRTSNNWWWIIILVVAGGGVVFFFIRKIPFVVIWNKIKKLV